MSTFPRLPNLKLSFAYLINFLIVGTKEAETEKTLDSIKTLVIDRLKCA